MIAVLETSNFTYILKSVHGNLCLHGSGRESLYENTHHLPCALSAKWSRRFSLFVVKTEHYEMIKCSLEVSNCTFSMHMVYPYLRTTAMPCDPITISGSPSSPRSISPAMACPKNLSPGLIFCPMILWNNRSMTTETMHEGKHQG